MDLEKAILANVSEEFARSTDYQMMLFLTWHQKKDEGWTEISINLELHIAHGDDIALWLEDNFPGEYLRDGQKYLLKQAEYATMLLLKWAE